MQQHDFSRRDTTPDAGRRPDSSYRARLQQPCADAEAAGRPQNYFERRCKHFLCRYHRILVGGSHFAHNTLGGQYRQLGHGRISNHLSLRVRGRGGVPGCCCCCCYLLRAWPRQPQERYPSHPNFHATVHRCGTIFLHDEFSNSKQSSSFFFLVLLSAVVFFRLLLGWLFLLPFGYPWGLVGR